MTVRVSNVAARAMLDTLTALSNGGTVDLLTGAPPTNVEDPATGTLLATLTLSNPAWQASVDINPGAQATANAITGALAVANGTAGYFRLKNSGGTAVWQGTVGGTQQSTTGDLQLNSSALVTNLDVEITSWTITHSE